jgi:membrane fusion protein (multidrug efflux system)
MGELYDAVEAIGTAQANESLVLTAKVTDTVRRVNFEDGQYVEADTVLIELTNEEEEALLDEARANLEDAENQLRRLEDLSRQGLSAESELDVARSRTAASAARLETVLARLRDRLILAPFSGLLGFRDVSPGTLVTPATALPGEARLHGSRDLSPSYGARRGRIRAQRKLGGARVRGCRSYG